MSGRNWSYRRASAFFTMHRPPRIFTSLNLPWIFPWFKIVIPQGRGMTALLQLCVIESSLRSRWLLIRRVLSCSFMDRDEVEVTDEASVQPSWSNQLVNEGLIIWPKRELVFAVPTREILASGPGSQWGKNKTKIDQGVRGGKRAVSLSPVHGWTRFARRCFTPFLPFSLLRSLVPG